MASFQVPQFIEEKSKIVGFLTLPQFLYLAGAGIIAFLSFKIFSFFLFLLVTAVVGSLAIAFAFVKVNGQPFPSVVGAGIGYLWAPRVYTWQRSIEERTIDVSDLERIRAIRNNMSLGDKLKNAILAATTGKLFKPEDGALRGPNGERYQKVTYLTGETRLAKRVDY